MRIVRDVIFAASVNVARQKVITVKKNIAHLHLG